MFAEPKVRSCFCGTYLTPLVQFEKEVGRWWPEGFVSASNCPNCGYVSFNPPADDVLESYYSTQYGRTASSWYNLEKDYEEGKVSCRAGQAAGLLQAYIDKVEKPTVLEVGCAFGGTVQRLRDLGYGAFGVDLNSDAISQGRKHGNTFIHDRFAHEFMGENSLKANLIYSYHALEHIPDLVAFLSGLKPILDDDSILSFWVPNGLYLRAWLEGFETWDWFAYPDHLHLLTPYSVHCLAEQAGFAVIEMTSNRCGEPLEAMAQQLRSSLPHRSGGFLETLLKQTFLLQELSFVLTPKGSSTFERHHEQYICCREKCQDSLNLLSSLRFDSCT